VKWGKEKFIHFTFMVPCVVFYKYTHKMSNEMQLYYLDFIARSLYMFLVLRVPIIRSTITAVDSHWYTIRYYRL
jgi:hypothetical protein